MQKVAASHSLAYFDDDSVDEPGFYLLEGEVETDENGVKHETNLTPGRRVFPAPDGDGFMYDDPASESGEEDEG